MRQGGGTIGGDDDPLAGRQAVVLDDIRRTVGVEGGSDLIRCRAHAGIGGRHPGGSHHVLGEGLGSLQLSGCCGRTEAIDACLPDGVSHPRHQGRLSSHDHQISLDPPGQRDNGCGVGGIDGVQGSDPGQSRIPGGGVQLDGGIGDEGAAQGVLTPTRAEEQNSGHAPSLDPAPWIAAHRLFRCFAPGCMDRSSQSCRAIGRQQTSWVMPKSRLPCIYSVCRGVRS